MKTYWSKLILFLGFCLLLSSCTVYTKDPIVGVWKVIDIEKTDSLSKGINDWFNNKNVWNEGQQIIFEENQNYQILNKNKKTISKGTWRINESRNELEIIEGSDSTQVKDYIKYTIETLTFDVLKLRKPNHKKLMILNKQL